MTPEPILLPVAEPVFLTFPFPMPDLAVVPGLLGEARPEPTAVTLGEARAEVEAADAGSFDFEKVLVPEAWGRLLSRLTPLFGLAARANPWSVGSLAPFAVIDVLGLPAALKLGLAAPFAVVPVAFAVPVGFVGLPVMEPLGEPPLPIDTRWLPLGEALP